MSTVPACRALSTTCNTQSLTISVITTCIQVRFKDPARCACRAIASPVSRSLFHLCHSFTLTACYLGFKALLGRCVCLSTVSEQSQSMCLIKFQSYCLTVLIICMLMRLSILARCIRRQCTDPKQVCPQLFCTNTNWTLAAQVYLPVYAGTKWLWTELVWRELLILYPAAAVSLHLPNCTCPSPEMTCHTEAMNPASRIF